MDVVFRSAYQFAEHKAHKAPPVNQPGIWLLLSVTMLLYATHSIASQTANLPIFSGCCLHIAVPEFET